MKQKLPLVKRLVGLRLYLETNRGHMQTLSGARYWKNGVKKLTKHIATLKAVERYLNAPSDVTARCEALTQGRFNHPPAQCRHRAQPKARYCKKHTV